MRIGKIIDGFPELKGLVAELFRYDRWDKILFLELKPPSDDSCYLALKDVLFISSLTKSDLIINNAMLSQEDDTWVLFESSSNFMIKFKYLELWSYSKFQNYDIDIYKSDQDKKFGIRKVIFSIDDLKENN